MRRAAMCAAVAALWLGACLGSTDPPVEQVRPDTSASDSMDLSSPAADLGGPDAVVDAAPDQPPVVLYYYSWGQFSSWFKDMYKEPLCEENQTLTEDADGFCVTRGGVAGNSNGLSRPLMLLSVDHYTEVVCF